LHTTQHFSWRSTAVLPSQSGTGIGSLCGDGGCSSGRGARGVAVVVAFVLNFVVAVDGVERFGLALEVDAERSTREEEPMDEDELE
jgi:hypothetical protein